jgi:hypothetical protein
MKRPLLLQEDPNNPLEEARYSHKKVARFIRSRTRCLASIFCCFGFTNCFRALGDSEDHIKDLFIFYKKKEEKGEGIVGIKLNRLGNKWRGD